jgi:hypothetical protein
VEDIEEVVKLVPVPNDAPPLAAAYQLIVPAEVVAPSVTVPVPHLDAGAVPVIVGIVFIVAVTAVLDVVVHPFVVAST